MNIVMDDIEDDIGLLIYIYMLYQWDHGMLENLLVERVSMLSSENSHVVDEMFQMVTKDINPTMSAPMSGNPCNNVNVLHEELN